VAHSPRVTPAFSWVVKAVKLSKKGGGLVGRLAGWCHGQTSDKSTVHQNLHQNIIFEVMSEVQKDLEYVSVEPGIFLSST
jgi:hypothetical protein